MSTEAVIMMIVAMLVIWGGLLAAIVSLSRSGSPGVAEIHRDL